MIKHRYVFALGVPALLLAAISLAPAAQAGTVTLQGTGFSVTYDPATIDPLFGAVSLSGDTIRFAPSNFQATSANVPGVVLTTATASGLILTADPGYTLSGLSLTEAGSYTLTGNSTNNVAVTGQLRAFDYTNPGPTQVTSSILPSAATPLNIFGSTPQAWQAGACQSP